MNKGRVSLRLKKVSTADPFIKLTAITTALKTYFVFIVIFLLSFLFFTNFIFLSFLVIIFLYLLLF